MTQEIPKEKAKYLKRMAKRAGKNSELTARTQNRRAAQRAQQEEIARRHAEIDKTGPSQVFSGVRAHILSGGAKPLNLNQQVAVMAGTMAAQQERELAAAPKPVLTTEPPHQHSAECNHDKPIFMGVDMGASEAIDTTNEFTPDTVREAMEKAQT